MTIETGIEIESGTGAEHDNGPRTDVESVTVVAVKTERRISRSKRSPPSSTSLEVAIASQPQRPLSYCL
ncbi:hypothetical protein EVAR_97052_1 [Eumeta japonica]|uniref:Uncharacterized protein n=1 Tax=Eumeta variegata TaxID=151549 RepID=A0A4C1WNT6_EUMVA|nr:hypothetical protein EVAR_97052_1 [Eumeta japonica]